MQIYGFWPPMWHWRLLVDPGIQLLMQRMDGCFLDMMSTKLPSGKTKIAIENPHVVYWEIASK